MEDYYYTIKTLKLMNHLVHLGFDVVKVADSISNPKYKTFFFLNTPELREAIEEYVKSNK